MKSPVTEVTITPELVEQLAGSMRLDITDMPVEEIQTGIIKELNTMQVYTIQAMDHHRLVRAFNTAYNNISANPTFYTNPEEDPGEFGHPLVGQQGTQFDKHNIMETLIKEELEKILDESRKKLHMGDFVKLPGDRKFRTRWLKMNGDKLGEGSSRVVYTIDSSKVLKQAINEKGVAQNEAEVKAFTNPKVKPIIAQIYDADDNYEWVVSEIVRPMGSVDEFEKLTGVEFEELTDIAWLASKNKMENGADDPFVEAVIGLVHEEGTLSADMEDVEHWGKTADGRVVLLDYGYTPVTQPLYYGSDPAGDAQTAGPSSDTIHRNNVAARKP